MLYEVITADAAPDAVQADPAVLEAYLGIEDDDEEVA